MIWNKKLIVLFTLFVVIISISAQQKAKKKSTKTLKPKMVQISFKNDVVPIFKKYCLPCHTEDQMNPSQLYLDSYENLMNGGKHGKPVTAGKADSSLMILKLSTKPPFGDPMPMKPKEPFTDVELKVIRDWITQGTKQN